MAGRIQDLLSDRAASGFVGRADEIETLLGALAPGQPPVWYLHGIAGVGKSRLLDVVLDRARAVGVCAVRLDCREIEPTAKSFLAEFAEHIGAVPGPIAEVAERIAELGDRVLIALDGYESFRLLDSWIRQIFLPALPQNVRIFLVGRIEPSTGWRTSPGWCGLFQALRLGPLPERDARDLLRHEGIEGESADRIIRFAQGCSLALMMAAGSAKERPGAVLDETAVSQLHDEIAARYLDPENGSLARRVIQASAVVRRITMPLLGAMLPDDDASAAWEVLRAQPVVVHDRDGLTFHDIVKTAVAQNLKSLEPDRYLEYRRAAWRHLRAEARNAGKAGLWRSTADLLYLLENPRLREAFFPVERAQLAVEPAQEDDWIQIRALAERNHRPGTAATICRWLESAPETFVVVRDADGCVAGFCSYFAADSLPADVLRTDPIMRGWLSHLRRHPIPNSSRALFVVHDHGEATCPTASAMWLDLKRLYLEMRPHLRRVYVAKRVPDPTAGAMRDLGFKRLPDYDVSLDGDEFQAAVLDMGPGSVDGWLTGLVAAELGVNEDEYGIVDSGARELVLDGQRVGLTKLEFELIQYLNSRAGRAVSRADLLADVWGVEYGGGSNVVDAVVRGVRRKMGPHAEMLESVRGTGYRLRVA